MTKLKSMSEAPKDGTRIIIVWETPNDDINSFNIRVAWWWKPTELHQWERGARPHWEYISDSNGCMSIEAPRGWMPLTDVFNNRIKS